eukprot:8684273-Pyramimonas_sp.AAC.1
MGILQDPCSDPTRRNRIPTGTRPTAIGSLQGSYQLSRDYYRGPTSGNRIHAGILQAVKGFLKGPHRLH